VLNGFIRANLLEDDGTDADSARDGMSVVMYRFRGTRRAAVREQK